MTRPINWLLSPLPLLKFSQSVCLLLVIVFFLEGRNQWLVYNIVYGVAFILLLGNLLSVVIHFFDISRSVKNVPWHKLELLWNVLSGLCCLALACVLFFDWWQISSGNNRHHSVGPPITIGHQGWTRRVAIVAGVEFVACIFFAIAVFRIRKHGLN